MEEDEILNARQVAEQNPELDATRRQLFGENYLQDIDQGTGIAQYYTGFGNMPTLNYTPPVVEETPAVDVSTPIVDIGGDGGGIDISTGNETGNTDFEQSLLDQGVGVQRAIGDPVVAPGEMLSTQAEMDAFNQIPVNREYGDPMNIGYGEGQVDPGLAAAVGGQDTTPLGGSTITGPTGDVYASDDPLAMEKIDFQTPEQTNAIGDAFNSVKDLGASGVDKLRDSLVALGGKVKEGFDNTIEIGGKTIDLTKSLIGGAISLATGIPGVGFLLNQIKEDPVDTYNQSLFSADDYLNSDMYKVDKDMTDQEYGEYKNRLGGYYGDLRAGNLEGQDPFGKNITSAFGDYEAMAQDIVDKVSSIPVDKRSQLEKDQLDFYGDVVKDTPAPQEDIGAIDSIANEEPIGDQGSSVNTNTGDITDSSGNYAGNIMDEFAAPSAPAPAPAPAPTYGPYGGGGGGGGGGGPPGSQGPGGSDAMGSFNKGGLAGLKRYAK